MGWWNGKFSRYEVHFGYADRNETGKLFWIHQARFDSKRSSSYAESNAQQKSKEFGIHVRVMDALKSKCIAMFCNGQSVDFSNEGEPDTAGALPNLRGDRLLQNDPDSTGHN